ncbi:hypothetical protein [Bradyrhizobium japonicum]|uniref:hypothetical protein n=1 Tax=Bradyrhizobium japonicum TaxID=375 RepID=UPI0020A15648|nr:hypothetical protein [Bradyrhizobium japonicum]MCP1761923.1 DNA-directed RNA polymerase subunit RPC12/RpoP [Bradyrhizobium japonicum]MCP1793503.1 DNA-directed RNA polymerase subunit RPC12/RpoP [Bradyrhizobium japonicum]MCP1805936.1 DNA-directed RNA polymerase subunit RPC12/RpoP [Bradyrhizobium japonicum]MCP1812339.1 DNA-directed RNA polymerase subunit RPC12/RpoP [Bradyrhizobium japonicum]MCP1873618.1 DNA-directed RNA polymerase subunit RPC12/RpoP [Bradyrhizobium japonicum]
MGDDPDAYGSAAAWQIAARLKGYKCSQCGAIPAYENRREYFETDLCEYCNYKANNPDRS